MDLHAKLKELDAELPPVTQASADYEPAVLQDGRLLVSAQVPMHNGALVEVGPVGGGNDALQAAQKAAERCVLNGLAAADHALQQDWSRFKRVLKLNVWVTASPEFEGPHHVANAASKLLTDLFGDAGKHARSAIGVASLPRNSQVMLDLELAVS